MICRKCGKELPENSRFCENCGAPVNEDIPNKDAEISQSNQQGNPDIVSRVDTPEEDISMNQLNPKKSKKPWGLVVVIVLIILGCLCVVGAGGGLLILRNQNESLKDIFSSVLKEQPGVPAVSIDPPVPDETAPLVPQIETTKPQSNLPAETLPTETLPAEIRPAETLLAVTSSGVWGVNEKTNESKQISFDQIDDSWDIEDGLSPDKKLFAYIAGFSEASVNPMLVVLDLVNQKILFQVELTGATIKPGMEGTHGDPAFEALGAMQYTDSLAWSPDGKRLAFVAARDGDSADVYLFTPKDTSISRLSNEAGHATALHWSPDGQLLQYISVNAFGTGAGFDMEDLWVYDFHSNQDQLLEKLESNGEEFLAWTDNSHFYISSWGRECGGYYNLRIVDAVGSEQQVIVDRGFTDVAYASDNKFGMIAVAYNYDNCGSVEPLDTGLFIFGESVPVLGPDGPIAGEIGFKKFEKVIAYSVSYHPAGDLFTVYGDEGLQNIYSKDKYGYNNLEILPELKGFVPYPSQTGDYWAWASRVKSGLWVTKNNSNPVELSPIFSGVPLWNKDGKIIYFLEKGQLFSASAPQFDANLLAKLPGGEILGLIK